MEIDDASRDCRFRSEPLSGTNSPLSDARERVRQIEVRAFQKVQRAAKIAIAPHNPHLRFTEMGLGTRVDSCATIAVRSSFHSGGKNFAYKSNLLLDYVMHPV